MPVLQKRASGFVWLVEGLLLLALMQWVGLRIGAQADNSEVNERIGWVPAELMQRPVTLRKGVGTMHEQVSTSSKQAQSFYDQGLAYLQSYVWIEAARSFHQALRYDPKLAMAYLGLSYAYSPMDFAATEQAQKRAEELSANASDRERRRVRIRALQLKAMLAPEKIELTLEFRDAIDDALAAYPNDTMFLLLRGVAQEPSPFADGQGCDMGGAPYFQQVLANDPENVAAHHYLTHCYENSGRIQEALPHARTYAELASEIPHAQHMYGHVLRRAGEMDHAIEQFVKADELDRDYFRRENIPAWYDWHYAHNLQLLGSSYQYLGQIKNAEKEFELAGGLPAPTDYDSYNRKDWPEFLLDRGRYAEALAAAREFSGRHSALAQAAAHALAGDAELASNEAREASQDLASAQQIESRLRPVDASRVRSYTDSLRAALLLKEGQKTSAEELFQGAVRRIRATNGPDAWTQGLFQLEFLCRMTQEEGDWGLAGQIAQAMYERAPDYAGSHYALAIVARHNGDAATALQEFSQAEKLWHEADADLPELREARRAVAELNRAGAQ